VLIVARGLDGLHVAVSGSGTATLAIGRIGRVVGLVMINGTLIVVLIVTNLRFRRTLG
jgi:hypothetical protein